MTKAQEKLLRDLFERSFKIVKSLNYNQVAWILHQVGWLNHFTDDELKEEILKRETDLEKLARS